LSDITGFPALHRSVKGARRELGFLSARVFTPVFISESPEEVKADRTFDGAARVLRDYRLCEIKGSDSV